jgi:hypothetical protein
VDHEGDARTALEAIERAVAERVARHRLHDDLATGAGEARPPQLVDLERHLGAWAKLVPGEAAARRELAVLLAARHPKGLADAAGVRGAVGVEGAARAGLVVRLRLRAAAAGRRAEAIPTVWLVALLTVGICFPAAVLGLPTAAATIGALPALAVLAVVGTLMTLSMAAEAEAIVRSRPFRAGGMFLGKLTDDFLGTHASAVATLIAVARTALSVLGGYIGLTLTLTTLTGVPRELWSTVTLALVAVMLLRGGLKITVDAGALVGLVGVVLSLAIAAIAIGSVDVERVTRTNVPGLGGDASAAAAFGPIVGMVLIYFIGNAYVIQVAQRTLPRDEGGGDVVRGIALGTAVLVVLAALFLVPVTGAVPAGDLAGEQGTALGPLADVAGPAVTVLGTAASILLLGLCIERASLALFKFTGERLRTAGVRRRVVLCSLGPLAMCAVGEVLIAVGDVSFNDVMGLSGVISNVVVTGVVPMLLVAGSRRLGELEPARTIGALGGAPVVTALTVLYTLLLVAFALLFYDTPVERAAAASAVLGLLAVVWLSRPARASGGSP